MATTRDSCAARVGKHMGLGAAIGASFGAVLGVGEAIMTKEPALLKIRHVGQRTVGSSILFGLFLGVGGLLNCGRG
ncbi:hypothetical protein ACHQM5_012726 [Ranunculus cassubicifolius]